VQIPINVIALSLWHEFRGPISTCFLGAAPRKRLLQAISAILHMLLRSVRCHNDSATILATDITDQKLHSIFYWPNARNDFYDPGRTYLLGIRGSF